MIPDFSSFVPDTSGAEYSLLDLKDVFHVAWVKIIKGLINFHAQMPLTSMHRD